MTIVEIIGSIGGGGGALFVGLGYAIRSVARAREVRAEGDAAAINALSESLKRLEKAVEEQAQSLANSERDREECEQRATTLQGRVDKLERLLASQDKELSALRLSIGAGGGAQRSHAKKR